MESLHQCCRLSVGENPHNLIKDCEKVGQAGTAEIGVAAGGT